MVTDSTALNRPSTLAADAAAAQALASTAAIAQGVTVRELRSIEDLQTASEIWHRVWGTEEVSVHHEVLKALSFSGNYVAGAYIGATMVAAAVAFRGCRLSTELHLHSHVVGVLEGARSRGVGLCLKLHERAWALAQGLSHIEWTFDPLQRRNAVFNIGRLGALPVEYHADFYGVLRDALNEGERTDRLLVSWDLLGRGTALALAGRPDPTHAEGYAWFLEEGVDGAPRRRGELGAPHVAIAVPHDITALRRRDPGLALVWRREVGGAIEAAVAAGYRFSGMVGREGYLLSVGDRRHHPETTSRT